MSELTITNLEKRYGALQILSDINLDIGRGELVVFVGPSGCGKSTLLRCIAGLEEISSGTLAIKGERMNDVSPSDRGIAMVFQSYALYPHMTVSENMAFALKLQRLRKDKIQKKVVAAAEKLELLPYLDRLPRALSGGQRQRVAIGRAIVRNPDVFLFDEPLSNLDAALRAQTRVEIARLKRSLPDTTMIYVTHDQVEAMTLADRIVVLNGGRVEQVGTPLELYQKPASQFVAGFIGSPKMNFITGEHALRFGAPVVGVRPEHFQVSQHDAVWNGTLTHVENLGSDSYLYVDIGAQQILTVRQEGTTDISIGGRVDLSPKPSSYHLFDANGIALARA
ncbi:ATP-binding cassette domain-containing protein (plasmid) [Agrobacterium leguminum]|uniref:ABC transporter ATP-binding protein n=1 Tax=Agrobacterium leguminum TaxID=2792015 RepID=UPI00272D1620|nr:ATP-binding cassette domain-containing protein [Agrobacterium leguminum]WLE00757.1 ATP-binding cassette domain-containing protein [Agrobacterium leguminum]